MEKRCDQCLYTANKIVSDERRDQLLEHCARTEQGFACHKATHAGIDAMCRAHWDATKLVTLRNRLALRLGVVVYVTAAELEQRVKRKRRR